MNNILHIFVLIVCFGTVQGIGFGNIFGWFQNLNPFQQKIGAIVSDCRIFKNGRRCKLNTNQLKLDADKSISLVVNTGGRTIKCDKKLSKGYKGWYGNCDGDADDANFISHVDNNGVESVFGSIKVGDDVCHIAPNLNGEQEINCIPKADFKEEDESVDPTIMGHSGRQLTIDTQFGFVPDPNYRATTSALRGHDNQQNRRRVFDDSGSTIDVLVVWTKQAECGKAGLGSGCVVTSATEAIMRGLVDLAIAETNTAYTLSGIFTSLRLVHAYREPDYVETSDFFTSLDRVTRMDDGFMDSVHVKRALYGADVVHMILGSQASCGLAWSTTPSIDYMFSVSNYNCATGYYSFGHEIGHNFNLFHDLGTENACTTTGSYNFGYRDPNAEFRTILSYDCTTGQCDNMPRSGCNRVQRFSNSDPAYTYNGKAIGNAQSDNAKYFNSERARVASFFPAMDCQSDNECNDGNATTTDTCNIAKRVCVFLSATDTPISIPTKDPVSSPTKAPVSSPTKAPVSASINAPVSTPTKAPVIGVPTTSIFSTSSPTRTPSETTVVTPTDVPISTKTSSTGNGTLFSFFQRLMSKIFFFMD